VCIDDFALKKREKYGTVMVDIETGNVVDMIESRDYTDVKKWLESFHNIRAFSRDGSITYSKAIKDSHPKAIQISDRFHLLKNLTDYCRDYIKRTVKNNIEIQSTKESTANNISVKSKYDYDTTWDLISDVKKLRTEGNTIDQISVALGLSNKTIVKYSKIPDFEKDKYNTKSTLLIKKDAIYNNKETLIQEVKRLDKKGYSGRKIANIMSLNRKTVKNYIESDGAYTHASTGTTRSIKLSPFKECIIAMHSSGAKSTEIIDVLRNSGYTGSESLVRGFISKINQHKAVLDTPNTEQIRRKHLISLLYKKIDNVKSITTRQLNMVLELHPDLVDIYQISRKFKELLFGQNADKLDEWINQTSSLNIPELNSFINGISRDIDAVRNAIIYKYSNGLAEGTVNKIKVIKRIMYGRCGFEMLKRKVLYANFN